MNKPSQATIIGRPPPTTWQELSRDCQDAFGGGHRDDEEHLSIFHHGIRAVFNLLEGEFPPLAVCKRAEVADEERMAAIEYVAALLRAIAKHEGEALSEDKLAERAAANIALRAELADGEIMPGCVIGRCAAESRVADLEDALNKALDLLRSMLPSYRGGSELAVVIAALQNAAVKGER